MDKNGSYSFFFPYMYKYKMLVLIIILRGGEPPMLVTYGIQIIYLNKSQ